MKADSDLLKAFQHFRRNPIAAGAYPCPRDWHGMAPAALALQAARRKVDSLPGLQAAHAAALAALAAPLDVSAELAALAGAERGLAADMEAEKAAESAYHGAKAAGALAPDFGPFAEAMKRIRIARANLTEARKALDAAQKREGQKATEKRAKELLRYAEAFRRAPRVWNKSGPWHGPQSSGPGLVYFEKPGEVFRNIKKAHEVGGRYNRLDIPRGYYGDNDSGNLCVAYVLQLRGRKGQAIFLPGFQFEESDDSGITVDMRGRAFESASGENWESAEREAAKAADQLAESHAEKEREYCTAWQAGSQWASLKEQEEDSRAKALAILAERRAARAINPAAFPSLCDAIRGRVSDLARRIQKSRKEREELADSVWDAAGRAAFCDGAELQAFPS